MRDEWEIAPMIPPPCYPLRWDREAPGYELLREQIDQAYKRQREAVFRQWPQQRVDLLKAWIDELRHYQSDPSAERPTRKPNKLGDVPGEVYLVWCFPPIAAYKIGHSKHTWEHRRHALKQKLGCKIEVLETHTPFLSRELMEAALHNHFNHCRRESTEFFSLSQEEVDDFKTTAKAVEWHLLPVEIIRRESRLRQLEAELHKAEQGDALRQRE